MALLITLSRPKELDCGDVGQCLNSLFCSEKVTSMKSEQFNPEIVFELLIKAYDSEIESAEAWKLSIDCILKDFLKMDQRRRLATYFLIEKIHHTRLLPMVIHLCQSYWPEEFASRVVSMILAHKVVDLTPSEVKNLLQVPVPKYQLRFADPVARTLIARQYIKTELLINAGFACDSRLTSFEHQYYLHDGTDFTTHPKLFSPPAALEGKTTLEAIIKLGLFELFSALKMVERKPQSQRPRVLAHQPPPPPYLGQREETTGNSHLLEAA